MQRNLARPSRTRSASSSKTPTWYSARAAWPPSTRWTSSHPTLIVGRYFADDQARVDQLSLAQEEASRAVEEYVEEHAIEDGPSAEAMDDDKITKSLASKRSREIKRDGDPDEIQALQHLVTLYDTEAATKKTAKESHAALDKQTLRKYSDLSETDVQALLLDDKWQATIGSRIDGEVNSLTLALVDRIQKLGERYAETVADLHAKLERLEAKVAEHLAAMGVMP